MSEIRNLHRLARAAAVRATQRLGMRGPGEDLLNAAMNAAVEALDTYDPSKGKGLVGWVHAKAYWAVLEHVREFAREQRRLNCEPGTRCGHKPVHQRCVECGWKVERKECQIGRTPCHHCGGAMKEKIPRLLNGSAPMSPELCVCCVPPVPKFCHW